MMKTFSLAILLAGLTAIAGCSSDPNATADVEGQRAPLAGPSTNTMNSPTTGQTSAGLPGGTESSAPAELDPDRGTQIR